MKSVSPISLVAVCSLLLLTGCGKKRPSEVFEAFANAVAKKDIGAAEKYSTFVKKDEIEQILKSEGSGEGLVGALAILAVMSALEKVEQGPFTVFDEYVGTNKARLSFRNGSGALGKAYFINSDGKWLVSELK